MTVCHCVDGLAKAVLAAVVNAARPLPAGVDDLGESFDGAPHGDGLQLNTIADEFIARALVIRNRKVTNEAEERSLDVRDRGCCCTCVVHEVPPVVDGSQT